MIIVSKTTHHIVSIGLNSNSSADTPNHPLLELIDLIFKQFKLVSDAQNVLLKNYLSVIQRHSITAKPYDIAEYWSQVQTVVCIINPIYFQCHFFII